MFFHKSWSREQFQIHGNLLPGVSIVEKGTTNGTVSDFDGNFELSVQEDAIIIFSYVDSDPSSWGIFHAGHHPGGGHCKFRGYCDWIWGCKKERLALSISQIKGMQLKINQFPELIIFFKVKLQE